MAAGMFSEALAADDAESRRYFEEMLRRNREREAERQAAARDRAYGHEAWIRLFEALLGGKPSRDPVHPDLPYGPQYRPGMFDPPPLRRVAPPMGGVRG